MMRELYERSIEAACNFLNYYQRHRIKNENNPKKGLFPYGNMLFEDGVDTSAAETCAMLYSNPDNKYYKDERMLDTILEICPIIEEKLINEDGTTNQMTSNFHSPAMFVMGRLAEVCLEVKAGMNGTEKEKKAHAAMVHLAARYAEGSMTSGFHTPNHRWVETASLLMLYNLIGDERYKEKADKYIAEKLDIDEYGEYSERSAGMYNEIMNSALLMAHMTGRLPGALDAVHKNLRMMEYYVDDENDVFSQNSRRTDKGERGTVAGFYKGAQYHLTQYYYNLLETAYLTGDLRLAKLAKISSEKGVTQGLGRPANLYLFSRHPDMKDWEPDLSNVELEGDYEHYQPRSNIVRKRTGKAVCSIIAKNPSFLFIRNGGIDINLRMCSSFFAIGQFEPKEMEKTEDGYRMRYHAECDYKLPFDVPPENSQEYWTMDFSSRKRIAKQDLDYTVDFAFVEGGVDMRVKTEHCDDVPFKLEIGINTGKLLEIGDSAATLTTAGNYIFAKKGFRVSDLNSLAFVSFEGLGCRHIYADNMRGGTPAQTDRQTVYFTDYTPFDKVVKIRYGLLDEPVNYYCD